jgi:uncharacterized protein (DUF983 family)
MLSVADLRDLLFVMIKPSRLTCFTKLQIVCLCPVCNFHSQLFQKFSYIRRHCKYTGINMDVRTHIHTRAYYALMMEPHPNELKLAVL